MTQLRDLVDLAEQDLEQTDALLRKAAEYKMTPAERQRQMISFIMGNFSLKSTVKREDVEQYIYEKYGRVAD